MKRWLILGAGVVLQMVLGGLYAWSEFASPLMKTYGLSQGQCGTIFGVTVASFAVAMIPGGKILHALGMRVTACAGAALYALGYVLASFSQGSFPVLLACFGLFIGPGTGIGYVCPLTAGLKWFPRNRGLVTGVAVAGFGGGAIVLSQTAEYLMYQAGYQVLDVFCFIGLIPGTIALLAALGLSEPECHEHKSHDLASDALRRHVFSREFLLISFGMFTGTFAGLLIIGNLKPMMALAGLSTGQATLSITIFALGNLLGRIVWGKVHDLLGSRFTCLATFGFFAGAILLMVSQGDGWLLLGVGMAGSGFGSCFVIFASAVVEKFGVRLFPKLYPWCFLAYGLAALIGPPVGGFIMDRTGSVGGGLLLSLGLILTNLLVIALWWGDAAPGMVAPGAGVDPALHLSGQEPAVKAPRRSCPPA